MAEKEEDDWLFVVHWTLPQGDAVVRVLCEYCAGERYTSKENIRAAMGRKMHVACVDCFVKLVQEHTVILGGSIRHGVVIE